MNKKIIVISGGEHAQVVMEAILLLPEKWSLLGFIDFEAKEIVFGEHKIQCIGNDDDIPDLIKKYRDVKFVCAIGDNALRKKVVEALLLEKRHWATLIHPEASVAETAFIGSGSVVLRNAVIQPNVRVGNHVIINTGVILEHDSNIGDYSHIAPGVVSGGGIKTGVESFIGLGSRIRDHITISDKVTVGIGSVVVSDIPEGQTVVGVPAKPLARKDSVNINDICVSGETTIREAMFLIGKYGAAAMIVDEEKHLLGMVNDADIRKALLKDTNIDIPIKDIMNCKFLAVNHKTPRIVALAKLKATGHRLMPILDDEKRIIGLHLIDSMVGTLNLPNIAVIMAGGKGVRLRPITENIPKPMVKVAGHPILEHIILHLAGSGIRKIYLAVNYLGKVIEDYFKDGSDYGVEINYIKEEKPLGTGGALKLLPEKTETPLLVMNGDLITQFDVVSMLNYHAEGEYKITIGVHDHCVEIPYGVIHWNDDKKEVDDIFEKPEKHFLVNGGVYVIDPEMLDFINPDENLPITDLIDRAREKNHRIGAHLLEGDWVDVGQHKDLATARGF